MPGQQAGERHHLCLNPVYNIIDEVPGQEVAGNDVALFPE